MKYYSDKLRKFFSTEQECLEEEEKCLAREKEEEERKNKLATERKTRAKEVEEAFKNVRKAQDTYHKLINDFVKDYGSFHMSISDSIDTPFFDTLFDEFFKL